MIEELEMYLEELRGSLEVEIDLHGSRSEMAKAWRLAIVALEKEIEGLKTANMV